MKRRGAPTEHALPDADLPEEAAVVPLPVVGEFEGEYEAAQEFY